MNLFECQGEGQDVDRFRIGHTLVSYGGGHSRSGVAPADLVESLLGVVIG